MKRTALAIWIGMLLITGAPVAFAATTTVDPISDEPLGTGTGSTVKPNIYYVFDDSGSMGWDYLPDSVKDNYCLDGAKLGNLSANTSTPPSINSATGIRQCQVGLPPYTSSAFNYIYYDPTVTYLPGSQYDSTSYNSMDGSDAAHGGVNWASVPKDAYGILSTGTTNLVTGYPDIAWCDSSAQTNCRLNTSNYQYPDLVKFNQSPLTVNGAPYYYTMSPSAYCTDYTMTDCVASQDATHAYPSNYRWCQSYSSTTKTYSNCQGLRDSTHVVPTYLGSDATGGSPASGTITIGAAGTYNGYQITSVTVNGVNLLSTSITGNASSTQNGLASALCTEIESYKATSGYGCPSVTGSTLTVTSTTSGAYNNGPIIVQGPSGSTVTYSTGSITITTATAGLKITSVSIGSTAYTLGSAAVATGSIGTTAQALCNSLKGTTSFAAVYRVRSGSTTWGTCNSASSGLVEIQRIAADAVDEGKAITVAGPATAPATPSTGTITFSGTFTTDNKRLRILQCGGVDVITQNVVSTGTSTTSNGRKQNLANSIKANQINGYSFSCGGTCASGVTSMTVTGPAPGVDCTANNGGTGSSYNPRYDSSANFTVSFSMTAGTPATGVIGTTTSPMAGYTAVIGAIPTSVTDMSGGQDTTYRTNVGLFSRVSIVSSNNSYPKAATRTDCAGSTCTYQEEMTNFANWYAYYRTRCDVMKTSIFRAFSPIGSDFRVGFNSIYDNAHLDIADFTLTQKNAWYAKLKSKTCAVAGTPLQKGLSTAGRYYAGKVHTTTDPIQYSCQKNFTFLSTDGYWNNLYSGGNTGLDLNGSAITDEDSRTNHPTLARPYVDEANSGNGTPGTLADVAKYYFDTDLRPTGTPHDTNDVNGTETTPITDWQHMVTFTMGLGMDGLLHYDPNYLTGASDDYNKIKAGTKNWGTPASNQQQNVDDLWHAAVNGHGQYFSAKNPTEVAQSLTTALTTISGVLGAAAAAATSNLEPVAGDNYLYAASYVTSEWTGDLEAKTIDVTASNAGTVSSTVQWSARDKLDTTSYSSRTIYTYDPTATGTNGKAKLISGASGWTDLSSTEQGYFSITGMSNYIVNGVLPIAANCNGTTAGTSPTKCKSLLDYLLGAKTGDAAAFRTRTHILGDIVHSQPVYIRVPPFAYTDSGYSAYVSSNTSRAARVYVGSNDGMLHAFNGDGLSGGDEVWSYVPSFVLPNWWRFADSNYSSHHRYYVDGQITAGDAYFQGAGESTSSWKSVVIGGLGKGGRGYYAIDVTTPSTPKVLWEFTDVNMGYTMGNPIITKLSNNTWVAVVTSGYDNVPSPNGEAPSGNGHGYVYVLNIADGSVLYTIDTGDGSTTDPSNLGKANNWVSDTMHNNTTMYVYAGDQHGNMWRFTLGTTSGTALKLMQAKTADGGTGVIQQITSKPELGSVDGSDSKRMVFFGTGRYLSTTDKTDTTQQSIYGLYDSDTISTTLTTPRASMVQQLLCGQGITTTSCPSSSPTTYRTSTQNGVTLDNAHRGWYIDLPDGVGATSGGSERVDIDVKLQLGTLVVASNVPTANGDCNVGGYSWLYQLNYLTGSYIVTADTATAGLAGQKLANALAVGTNLVRINDKLIDITTTSDKRYPVNEIRIGSSSGTLKRTGWRELIEE